MSIRIVSDSTCDLPIEIAAARGITIVPCYVNIGDKSYLDGVELSREEFYTQLPRYKAFPKTAAPGIGIFLDAYRRLIAEGAEGIISIHPPARLSNLMQVAALAGHEVAPVPVAVVDSGQITLGTGILALTAARLVAEGLGMVELVTRLEDQAKRTWSIGVLSTLEFLRRGGRVSWLQSVLATLLQIKPVFGIHQGDIFFERTRTRAVALRRLIERVTELMPLEHLSVVHTHAPDQAEELRQLAQSLFPADSESLCAEVAPVLGAHLGPQAVGLVCVAKSK